MLFNNLAIRKIMYQTDPMLMLKLVEKTDDMVVKADINIDDIWSKELTNDIPLFIVIESMGQAAEFTWRKKGKAGRALLVGINNLTITETKFMFDKVHIIAEADSSYRNICKSNVSLINGNGRKIIETEITHCFVEK